MPCCCVCKSSLGLLAVAGLGLALGLAPLSQPADKASDPAKPAPAAQPKKDDSKKADAKVDPFVLGFKMKRIEGAEEDLATYKGKVVLIVNVASKCGYTPQYEGLEKLYESKKDKGFVILGFPANEFGKQEPGTNEEIKEFCTSKYSVKFPMFEKIVVKGDGVAPLYKKLAAQPAPIGGEPKWNFTKFLVDKKGNVVARYEPKVAPDDEKLSKKIDELLSAK